MKFLILTALFITSTVAIAGSSKLTIRPFRGEFALNFSDIKIDSANLRAAIQHCNVFNTICEGGPQVEKYEDLSFHHDTSSNLLVVELKKKIEITSLKPLNPFYTCELFISFSGRNPKGEIVYGLADMIHEEDKEKCESETAIQKEIKQLLRTPWPVKFWKRNPELDL